MIAFVDTETTGLNPDTHEVWELAIIKRVPTGDRSTDVEVVYQIRPDLVLADDKALEIGRFHDRFRAPPPTKCAIVDGENVEPISVDSLRYQVSRLLQGATMVGSNPAFDATFIRKLLGRPATVPWNYRTMDVATLAAGFLVGRGTPHWTRSLPLSSRLMSEAVGVAPPPPGVAHAALADARWARDVWDAVFNGGTS